MSRPERKYPEQIRFEGTKEHKEFVAGRKLKASVYLRALLDYAKERDIDFKEVIATKVIERGE